MDNIIAGAIEAYREYLANRLSIYLPYSTGVDFLKEFSIDNSNPDTDWHSGNHVDRALKVITNALKATYIFDKNPLYDELKFVPTPIYMKFDPETGIKIPNTTPELYRETHTGVAWLFNPYTGDKRDSRDIGSDVFGLLMVAPGESIKALKE